MPLANPMYALRSTFTDKCGTPLAGGKVYTYKNNSLIPKATFTDAYMEVPNTNPIILDETGKADIFLDGTYRFQVFSRDGVLIEDKNNVSNILDLGPIEEKLDKFDADFQKQIVDFDSEKSNALDAFNNLGEAKLAEFQQAIDIAAAAGAGANGWTANLISYKGSNQEKFNDDQLELSTALKTKLDRIVTPFDFGAIGDGSSHKLSERYATLAQAKAVYPHAVSLDDEIDWCAVQTACIESMKSYKDVYGRELDLSGYFCINRPIVYATKAQTNDQYHVGEHRTFKADLRCNIADVFTGDFLMLLHGRGIKHIGSIRADLQKKVKYGIVVSERYTAGNSDYINMGIELDRVFIDRAKIHNVYFRENSMFSVLNFYRGGTAGAGDLENRVVTTITSRSMTTGLFEQRSHLTVAALPDFTLAELEDSLYVRVGKYLSRVKSITGNTLNVYPLIPDNETSSELQYIYGCGVKISGSDSAGLKVGEITDIGSGIGLHNNSMYPPVVTKLVTEFTGIAHLTTGLVGGTAILSQYFEGDLFQHIQDTEGFGLSGTSKVLSSTAAEIPRFDNLFCPRNLDGTPYPLYGGMRGMTFNDGSITHKVADGKYPQNFLANGPSNGRGVNFNIPHQVTSYYAPGNFYIDFHPINAASNNTFCYDSQEYILSGDGANGAPVGLITVRPLVGYKLNGGTSALEFYGFKSACHLHFMLDVVNKNIIVSLMSESSPRVGTTAQRPINPPFGTWYYDTTLSVYGMPIYWNGGHWINMTGTIV